MLQTYMDAWHACATDTLALLGELDETAWSTPTDLPGWSVGDVAAHLAHLEAVGAGLETDDGPVAAGSVLAADYTARGVEARRGRDRAVVIEELQRAVETRAEQLVELPADPQARADRAPAGVPWSWETLLRNRCVDMWTHEQDVRRAVGRPGGLDSPAAVVTTHSLASAMPYVLGKKVGAPAGTSVRWILTGGVPLDIGAAVGDDGRAHSTLPDEPTAGLRMTSEAFAVLAAGRRGPDAVEVGIDGDADLGRRVLELMAVTF